MTRDYARSTPSRVRPTRKPAARRKPRKEGGFSAPSFSAGAIFGAGLMLLAAWTPAVLQESVSAVRTQVAPPPEDIVFEFDDMLVENTVATDTSAYPVQFQTPDAESPPDEFLLQAASLRTPDKAEILKTQLRGQGLPAYWDKVVLESGTWYRVSVGPFPSKVEANRALTRLRSQNLTARLIKLG